MKRKYPEANCMKQTRDNGKNEARDDGKKKGQGIMVNCDTRINCKKNIERQLLKIDRGQMKNKQGAKVKAKQGLMVKKKQGIMV